MAASQAARKVEKSKIGEEEETEDSEPRALNVPKPLTGHYGPKRLEKGQPDRFQGWLLKWTNYIKGYQRRWFVLSNGLLSYYRTQEEMAHTCRGTINLAGTFIDTVDSTHFVITNGPSQVYHLRAQNEVERQRWVTMLELTKARAIKNLESDDSDSSSESEDEGGEKSLAALKNKLRDLNSAYDLVSRNSHALLQQIAESESSSAKGGGKGGKTQLREKLALFKVTTDAIVKASDEFVSQARSTEHHWSRALQHERSLRRQLQDNLETLASQMHGLESRAMGIFYPLGSNSSLETSGQGAGVTTPPDTNVTSKLGSRDLDVSSKGSVTVEGKEEEQRKEGQEKKEEKVRMEEEEEDDEDKFFDAPEILQEDWEKARKDVYGSQPRSPTSVNEAVSLLPYSEPMCLPVSPENSMSLPAGPAPSFFDNPGPSLEKRRINILPRPDVRLNIWSILKNLVGKDLTKMSMPVVINEPISFIQRIVEDLTYADLLERGAACDDTLLELAHVAAFAVSVYCTATVPIRLGKPFNPLLGETFECDRRAERGWRCFVEQVSHHPPMLAMYVEHKDWTLWQEYTVASKFRGNYIVCYPIGNTHLVFHKSHSHYTWSKVAVSIHNIIVGKMWVDQSGEAQIKNHTSGEECHLKFHAYKYFSREQPRKVTGTVNDADGKPRWVMKGYWDEKMECAKVLSGERKSIVTEPPKQLWTLQPPQPNHKQIYGFAEFTCTLNEMEEGVAPTDSRLRPDQRYMEEGDFDTASTEKVRLEEKQRVKRRKREVAAAAAAEAAANGNQEAATRLEKESTYTPLWFQKEYDSLTNTMMYVYKGGYWEGKLKGGWDVEFPELF